jgi:chemotaxis protein CheX
MTHDNDDIVTIAKSVLALMLDMNADLSLPHRTETLSDIVTGCVQISGEWQGAVLLQTSAAFATQAAARMLSIPTEEVTESDLLDALAELTNMIGGNLKSLVPGPSFLSLPCVTSGHDFHLPGAMTVSDVSLSCLGEPLRILKCERQVST